MALTYFATCALCQQRFVTPGFEDLLTTEAGRARLGTILEALHQHAKEKHVPQFASATLPSAQMLRLLVLMQFQTDDPVANQMREFMRHQLHMVTKARTVNDDSITEHVRAVKTTAGKKLPPEFHAQVIGIMQQMRDILEESGEFAPKQPGAPVQPGPVLVTP
jgi:hypothetical protein